MSRDPRINHGEEDLRRPGKPVPSRRTREEEGEERREDRREERRSDGGSRDSRDAAVVRAGSRPRRPVERQRPAREEAVRVEVVSQRDDTPERRADCDADARDSQLGVLYAEALETVGHSTANGLGARGARRLFHKTPRPERSAEKNLGVSLSLSLSQRERQRERERDPVVGSPCKGVLVLRCLFSRVSCCQVVRRGGCCGARVPLSRRRGGRRRGRSGRGRGRASRRGLCGSRRRLCRARGLETACQRCRCEDASARLSGV